MKIPELTLPAPPRTRSALGRPLDPRYASNWIAVLGSGATFLFFLLYNLVAAEPLPTAPISAGLTVFLAWAIGREIDPDHNATAYVAMIVAFASTLFLPASPLFGFGVLIGTRLTAGTVGLRVGWLDLMFVVGFGALLGSGLNSLAAVPALAVGVLVIDRYSRRSLLTALAAGAAALLVFAVRSPAVVWEAPGAGDVGLALIVGASLVLSVPAQRPVTLTDVWGRAIEADRVTAARTLVAGCVGTALLIGGAAGLQAAFAVAGASLVGTVVTGIAAKSGLGSRSVEAL